MQLSEEEMREFKLESLELVETAERSLLALDGGGDFKIEYDAIFRSFHNLKGSAGMLELTRLQAYLHQVETMLTQQKEKGAIQKSLIDDFLKSCDQIRKILDDDQCDLTPLDWKTSPVNEPAPLRADIHHGNDQETAIQFILEYYIDLDNYYLIRGAKSERTAMRERVIKILNISKQI